MFENSYSVVIFLKASLRHNPLFPPPITCTEATSLRHWSSFLLSLTFHIQSVTKSCRCILLHFYNMDHFVFHFLLPLSPIQSLTTLRISLFLIFVYFFILWCRSVFLKHYFQLYSFIQIHWSGSVLSTKSWTLTLKVNNLKPYVSFLLLL